MLVTLRIQGWNVFIPRSTGDSACALTIPGKEYIIPRQTFVVTNLQALHRDRKTWSADALQFRPSRWVKHNEDLETEVLFEPRPGTFAGWADGPRICPGKNFSQFESTAVMATSFKHYKVQPKQEHGEGESVTAERLEKMIQGSGILVTLQMRHPRSVALVWFPR